MGCDGGTIPKRHELVKGPKKVEKVDKNAELAAKWKYCALSQEKLKRPIVACELGRLYNKDAIIEYLLDKSAERPNTEVVAHIRSLKDVKELNLTDNPAWEGERRNIKGDCYEDMHLAMFICPVVGLEMSGKHKFFFLQTCGCVFSERALREVKTVICHKCGDPFQEEDLVVLNGTKEEVETLQKAMEERRSKAKIAKKSKKSKDTKVSKTQDSTAESCKSPQNPSESKSASENGEGSSGSSSDSAPGPSTSGESLKTVKATAGPFTGSKRSIQDMKDKSEAFKSLFTSHSSAKRTKDQTSNWVTHTPYHF
ncbi:replication termination factor 2 [Danio rerio]|uniref:Replication termination factor 2 n=1 Tax=Danio rerio TaxID=7955 RepID=Q7ZW03_DANRE|nr:replication termination factor 2 [Danio rerio]AAH45344.1 Zgc:55448 [Danio rerio]|eukprot:NP_956036.1 protein RTF2 homolog [Danio rerio]